MSWQACSRHSSQAHIACGFYLAWMWTASDFKRKSPCLKQVQADQPQARDRKRNQNVRNHLELVAWQNMPGSWSHGCVAAPGVPLVEGWTSPHLLHQRKHSSWQTLTLAAIIFDAMLEGFDTGASWLRTLRFFWKHGQGSINKHMVRRCHVIWGRFSPACRSDGPVVLENALPVYLQGISMVCMFFSFIACMR